VVRRFCQIGVGASGRPRQRPDPRSQQLCRIRRGQEHARHRGREETGDHAGPDGERHVVDGHGGAVALDQPWASIIALCERDGDVAVVVGDASLGDGSGREKAGDPQAEVFGLEGKTLILDALLLLPSPQ